MTVINFQIPQLQPGFHMAVRGRLMESRAHVVIAKAWILRELQAPAKSVEETRDMEVTPSMVPSRYGSTKTDIPPQ